MNFMNFFTSILSSLIALCYRFLGSYTAAIILFTALTKVILFPITLWTHRNGIRMVELTPELNEIKIQHYGDQDAIAEETQALYKRRGYHPLASLLPLFIQIFLLMGVIGAVRGLLAGTDSIFSKLPSQEGGLYLMMPVLAGLAALALGVAQNHMNPLQREQSSFGQWATDGVSIAISLFLGAFVPVGVGVYWIAGNLLTIVQQAILNAVIPPARYVDYGALEKSRKELAAINSLSTDISKEDRKREKEDYRRFFSVANKHLVFYSEGSGFYKYFEEVIEYLLEHTNIIIHYITSDPKDQIFELAKSRPHIRPYYIGEKRLITLMMKMDADIVVMTMPDIDNFHIKRSYVRKDVEYVYMFHGIFSGIETLRKGALDHYDTLLLPASCNKTEIMGYNEKYHIPNQKMVPCGYGVMEQMAERYEQMPKEEHLIKTVLVAPSWQEDNILESCLGDLAEPLLAEGYDVTVRPHPQYIRRFPQKLKGIMADCEGYPAERFRFQLDFASNETVYASDILVTDWSNIGYEYAIATKKPALFVNTPRKQVNEGWTDEDSARYTEGRDIREAVGVAMEPGEVRQKIVGTVNGLLSGRDRWETAIEEVRRDKIYHFGESGKYGAKYLIDQLMEKQKSR